MDGATDMLKAMSDRKKGQAVTVGLVRDGKPMTVKATMEDDPGSFDADLQPGGAWRVPDSGFQLGDVVAGADRGLRRDLERAAKRIEELEKRLEKLERR